MTRRAWSLGLIVAALLVVSLYRAKYGARDSAAEARELRREIAALKDEIGVLQAEFAHLARETWIAEYAREVLGMAPPRPGQFAGVRDIAAIARDHADAGPGEGADDPR